MENERINDVAEQEFKKLEYRVNELIQTVARLKDENRALRETQQGLVAERASLLEKNELARSKVESMIARLRAMDTVS